MSLAAAGEENDKRPYLDFGFCSQGFLSLLIISFLLLDNYICNELYTHLVHPTEFEFTLPYRFNPTPAAFSLDLKNVTLAFDIAHLVQYYIVICSHLLR